MKEKVVLAYSGGLDTTALIPWLKETFDYWTDWMKEQSFPVLPNYISKIS